MKDPAFNFYSDNFLSGTMFFTDEQVGKYIRLLCAQHQTGHLEEKHMIFICKTYDDDIFKKFKKDDKGLYYNERLEIEINKRKAYSESRSNNKKGKVKEVKPDKPKTNHKKNISKSYEVHMGIGIGIGILNIEYEKLINEWLEYKKERGESYKSEKSVEKFINSLQSLSKNDSNIAKQIIEKSMSCNWAGIFELKNNNNVGTNTNKPNNPKARDRSDETIRATTNN